MLMTRQLLPGMLHRRRGHFVYISSLAGKVPSPRVTIYSAAKVGLRDFCGSLPQDLHGSGVSASVVFPGTMTDAGLLADARLPSTPSTKGTSCAFVARRVIDSIEQSLGEVDAAELPVRMMARFAAWCQD
jgi:short-subunit dehydrogenase